MIVEQDVDFAFKIAVAAQGYQPVIVRSDGGSARRRPDTGSVSPVGQNLRVMPVEFEQISQVLRIELNSVTSGGFVQCSVMDMRSMYH